MLNTTIKKLIILMFLFSLTACANTLEGVGADIEKMGKSIKESVGSDKDADSKK